MNPFTFGLTVTALSLIALHWFPYYRRLHVIGNYVLGVLAIFIGLTIWLWGNSILIQAWAFPVVGGAAVTLCYLIDRVLNLQVKARLNESERDRVSEATRD
jgi:hypothetical protein